MIDRIEFYYGDDPETLDKATLTERHYILTWDHGDPVLSSPADIAVDGSCNVYVADAGNNRVQKFDCDGVLDEQWSFYTLNTPRGICYDGAAGIYVADTGNNRVVQLDSATGAFAAAHTGFSSPCGVAATGDTIYVADTGNGHVMRSTYEDEEWSEFAEWPDAQTSFTAPTRLALTSDGYLYIVESGVDGGRVRKFNNNGTEVQNELWQTEPVGNAGGIAVDGKGRVYICDVESHEMKRYSADGTFEAAWGGNGPGAGGSGTGAGQFNFSDALGCGVAVSSALTGPTVGYIYVADSGNDRVQRFAAENTMTFCGVFADAQTEVTITKINDADPASFAGFDPEECDTIIADVNFTFSDGSRIAFAVEAQEPVDGEDSRAFQATWTVLGGEVDAPQVAFAVGQVTNFMNCGNGIYQPARARFGDAISGGDYTARLLGMDFELEAGDDGLYTKGGSKNDIVVIPHPTDPDKKWVFTACEGDLEKVDIDKDGNGNFILDVELRKVEDTVALWANKGVVRNPPIVIEMAKGELNAFETLEFRMWLNPDDVAKGGLQTRAFTPSEMFNAYDTARKYIRVAVVVSNRSLSYEEIAGVEAGKEGAFTLYDPPAGGDGTCASIFSSDVFVVPAFYMRETQTDPLQDNGEGWRWRARIGLAKPGKYFFYPCARLKPEGTVITFPNKDYPQQAKSDGKWEHANFVFSKYPYNNKGLEIGAPTGNGPMTPPSGRYFKRLTPEGEKTFFGLGYARPWNLRKTDVPGEGDRWQSAYIPFEKQMGDLKKARGNMFSWWLVSWDSNPVHGMDGAQYKEYWDEDQDGEYTPSGDIKGDANIGQPYQYFDQGRCKKTDELFDEAEKNDIYIMLTLWPHPDLRTAASVGWDTWCTQQRYGPKYMQRYGRWRKQDDPVDYRSDGFSSGWASEDVTPAHMSATTGDLWKYQQNLYRYIIARWGCRRGLGLYELIWARPFSDTIFSRRRTVESPVVFALHMMLPIVIPLTIEI